VKAVNVISRICATNAVILIATSNGYVVCVIMSLMNDTLASLKKIES